MNCLEKIGALICVGDRAYLLSKSLNPGVEKELALRTSLPFNRSNTLNDSNTKSQLEEYLFLAVIIQMVIKITLLPSPSIILSPPLPGSLILTPHTLPTICTSYHLAVWTLEHESWLVLMAVTA
jgi:hypothetical protein